MLEISSWTVKSMFVLVYISNWKIKQTTLIITNELVMVILLCYFDNKVCSAPEVICHRRNTHFHKTTNVMNMWYLLVCNPNIPFFRRWQKKPTTVYLRIEVTASVYLQVQWEITCTKVETGVSWWWQQSARRGAESPHREASPRFHSPNTAHLPHEVIYCLVNDFS